MNDFSCRFISEGFFFWILTILDVKVIDELMSKQVLKKSTPPKKKEEKKKKKFLHKLIV